MCDETYIMPIVCDKLFPNVKIVCILLYVSVRKILTKSCILYNSPFHRHYSNLLSVKVRVFRLYFSFTLTANVDPFEYKERVSYIFYKEMRYGLSFLIDM